MFNGARVMKRRTINILASADKNRVSRRFELFAEQIVWPPPATKSISPNAEWMFYSPVPVGISCRLPRGSPSFYKQYPYEYSLARVDPTREIPLPECLFLNKFSCGQGLAISVNYFLPPHEYSEARIEAFSLASFRSSLILRGHVYSKTREKERGRERERGSFASGVF